MISPSEHAPVRDEARAIEAWKQALGAAAVAADEVTTARYARTTLDTGTRPLCILYPTCTEQVQAAVRIAAAHGIGVYPVSRGRNWGYGDACAPQAGDAIVDLQRMNQILEVSTDLAYAVIEAGVSQRQLHEHLSGLAVPLWFDASGAGFEASLVGNTLDRGFGHTRYGDHFLTTCGMEIVLADGRILNTGFGHFPNARAGRAYRYGVGPFLDGLFCQSNYGIVTKIGLWLMPKPEAFTFFFIKLDDERRLAELIDRLRPLRLNGVLQSAIHIGNDLRLLSQTGRYPWEEANGVTPLPDEVRRRYRQYAGIGAWNAAGSLTGTAGMVRAGRKALREAMRGLGRPVFVDDAKLALGDFAAKCLGLFGLGRKMRSQLETLKPNYGLLKGIPTDEPLLGAQWRLRHPPKGACDPLTVGCGVFWVSPVLPAVGAEAEALLAMANPIFAAYGFELLVTFTLITERAMIAIMNVVFDKSIPEESECARRCYEKLAETLYAAGFYPYRSTLPGMSKLGQAGDVFWEVAKQIKAALDPNDIIARGRYVPPLK